MQIQDRSIWVTFQKEGTHCYPEAGTNPDLADVSFLQYPHRHIFHFHVEVSVEYNDRDIEFIQLKRWCEEQYDSGVLDVDYQSCEMIAEDFIEALSLTYPGRQYTVTVSEDGENGATLTGV